MDVLVCIPKEVRRPRPVHGTLLRVIEKEGKAVYERSRV